MPNDPRIDPDDPLYWDASASDAAFEWQALEEALEAERHPATFNWWQAWKLALTRPTLQTFETLLKDPNATLNRANSWLALAGAISSVSPIIAGVLLTAGRSEEIVAAIISASCSAPFGIIAYMIIVLFGMVIVHIAARALGGDSSFDKVAYALTLSVAPLTVVVSVLSLLLAAIMSATLTLATFLGLIATVFAFLYQAVLAVFAVQAVYRIGWGESTVAALAPALVIYACGCSCLSLVLASSETSLL